MTEVRYRIQVGGKSKLDGPIRPTLEEAWQAFLEKRKSSLPNHIHLSPSRRSSFRDGWEVVTPQEFQIFLKLARQEPFKSVTLSRISF